MKEVSVKMFREFENDLLFRPHEVPESKLFGVFKDVAGEKGSLLYRVGALGGIKPISLFAYRFKAYEGFIKWLKENNKNLYDIAIEELQVGSLKLFRSLNDHPILEAGWVGNDPKACRMFVDWVIFLFNEILEREGIRDGEYADDC
ncbi:MAG: hypothetical protein QXO16_05190 [Archaeoglobaceae archaeon]